jgi:copper resistance protein B
MTICKKRSAGRMRRVQGGIAFVAGLLIATAALAAEKEEPIYTFLQVEQLEHRWNEGGNSIAWEADAWIGGDENKLWLKTEGERLLDGRTEKAEGQALYSRMIAPFWDAQVGFRYDFDPNPERGFAVLGVNGLAPYFFEVDAAAFVSEDGDLSARFGAEYDLLLTQRLIVQPSLELNAAASDATRYGIKSGFNDIELGLRVRYEMRREFAPYVGISWERKLGGTADLARDEGEDIDNLAFVAGLRFWF